MELNLRFRLCCIFLLSGNLASGIMTGHEKPTRKPDPHSEKLPWDSSFGTDSRKDKGRLVDETRGRQVSDFTSNLCPSGVTGQFPYAPDCKRFVNCWKGRGMIQVCGPGTLFNAATGECDYPDKVKCFEGNGYSAYPQPTITRFPDSRPAISENPRISRKENYQSESVVVRPYPGRPPYFGPSHLTRPPTRPNAPTTAPRLQEVRCPDGGAGLYPHPLDCSKFLNCWGGKTVIQKCGPGTLFNANTGVCDHAEHIMCDGRQTNLSDESSVLEPEDQVEDDIKHGGVQPNGNYFETEDLYSAGSNVFAIEARTKSEENDVPEKPEVENPKRQESEEKKERDPSWGKILNWNPNRIPQPDGGPLYYDAHGNPVSAHQYGKEVGKPTHPNQFFPEQSKPINIGDSSVYYIRPHNHVMNQYPPHLQNNWSLKHPVYHNPQSFTPSKPQPNRPQPYNPYYPSAPVGTIVPGHYILVEDVKIAEPKKTEEFHQTNEPPPRFLVPPAKEESTFRIVVPSVKVEDRVQKEELPTFLVPPKPDVLEEPSRDLLPPHEDSTPIKVAPVNYDYNKWRPYYDNKTKTTSTSTTSTTTTTTTTEVPTTQRNYHWWREGDRNPYNPRTTTPKPAENWGPYYDNRNPYGISTTVTERTNTIAPRREEVATTTGRVYVVYPVKNEPEEYIPSLSQYGHEVKNQPSAQNQHKHKGTPVKKVPGEEPKLRIKPEVDFADSKEGLHVKDVEMFDPSSEALYPNARKNIRLKPLSNHLDGYVEMKRPNGEWGLVCDSSNGWMINEATVVCKELGYGRGAQISWQGYPLDSSTESIPVSVSEVTCFGNEESIDDCAVKYGDFGCDITKNAVGLRCFDNVTTQCHPEEVEYNNSCYRLVKRDDLDDKGLTLDQAADYCKKIGGRITDILSEEENDFISQWLMDKHPDTRSALTGGIGSAVMGRSLWMWLGSESPMLFQKWWKGWADEIRVKQGSVHGPQCIVLRKSFPCFVQEENPPQVEIELGNVEPEFCAANYFFWDVEECHRLTELNIPHICKKPLEEIGCVVGRGENYSGTASVTASGLPCLPWDHPEVKERLANQVTLQEWSTKLSGHNFCRNLGRQELHPWCFVEGKENSEYCVIPQCWDSVPGYSKSATLKSSCPDMEFECKQGECIARSLFCNGKRDCSNGRDEAMCSIFLQEFTRINSKRMEGLGKEIWPNVNENTCAKLCLENKNFKCKSFSYQNRKRTCHLSDTNMGLSGLVLVEQGWTYYELAVSSLNCSLEKGFMGCDNGKCVNVSNICDGKNNCGDGSDEVDCRRLGYQIRLRGSSERNKGRVEVKVLGKWGAICDDKFDLRDGEVVCRELGFKHGVAEILPNSQFPMPKPFFLMDDLECFGNETSVRECPFSGWGVHDCKPEETVGVACRVPDSHCPDDHWHCRISKECIPITYLCDTVPDCDDKSDEEEMTCNKPIKLRLVGGTNETAGRLEIQYLGTWGTICDDGFNDAAASVACRILGYEGSSNVWKNAHFGPGKGPIWLDGVYCYGNETNIDQCDHSLWGKHNCKHDEDVSISCSKLNFKQKSSTVKVIAHSSDISDEKTPAAKMKEILLKECSDTGGGTLQSIPMEQKERVVGSNVVPGGIPWQASIRVKSPGGKSSHWCGAVIISPYHILTAGHCLRDYSKPAYFVRVGDFDTEVSDPEEQEFGIDHLYVHPEFNRKMYLSNDIALVKIKGEIRFSDRVKPACLSPSIDVFPSGTNCSISGWGSISALSSGFARTLRRAYVPILEPSICKAPFVYGDNLSDGMFCAGRLDGGVDSCQGDSGGPLMCRFQGREYLHGITSWGHGCGRANKPGVYTNVPHYSDWIQEKIKISLT